MKNIKPFNSFNSRSSRYRKSRRKNRSFNFTMIAILVMIVAMIGVTALKFTAIDKETVTVNYKERVNRDEDSKYLIFTESGTFENTDAVLKGKFNSSDIYGKIKVGQTYQFTVWGWRIPFLSQYRNILEYQEITNETQEKN